MARVHGFALCLLLAIPAGSQQSRFTNARSLLSATGGSVLHYEAEWRLMRSGVARLTMQSQPEPGFQANLHLETVGLAGKLYKVNNDYSALFDEQLCASSTLMHARESKKRRETRVTFNQPPGKASLLERDTVRDQVVSTREIDVPPCVHDVLAGLARLRVAAPEIGQTTEYPISDGRKSASARIAALGRERVKTPAGVFDAVRYEAFLFNDVIYRRKGRLFVWISDDARRLPVQIRIQLPFYIGTVTLKLEKQEPEG
jgi:hypothetical protein